MAGQSGLNLVVFLSSVRVGRMNDRVGKFVAAHATERKHTVTVLDPLELKLPLLEKPLHHYGKDEAKPENLVRISSIIEKADAFLVCSAEYNHSIPPALSNLMSHFGASVYAGKPVGIVTYSMGPFGGVRAAMQLRAFLAELGMLSTSFLFAIPTVQNTLTAEGVGDKRLEDNFVKLMKQVEWVGGALRAHKQLVGPIA